MRASHILPEKAGNQPGFPDLGGQLSVATAKQGLSLQAIAVVIERTRLALAGLAQ